MLKIISQIILIILFVGCRNNNSIKTELNFWGFGAEGEQVKILIDEFEKENPDIKVKVQQIPWTAAHEKLLTAFAGSSTPDVCQLGNTWIPEFSALKSLENLDPFLNNSQKDKNDFFKGIFKTNIIDSALYGIPWYVDTRVMFYRKDLFEKVGWKEPPKTWNDLKLLCLKLKELDPEHFPLFLPANEWNPQIIFGLQNNSTLLKSKNTLGDFSGDEFSRAMDFYLYFHKNKLSPPGMSQVTNIYQAFTEGFVMIYITGPWNIGEFQKRIPKEKQNIWMTAPMPTNDSIYPGTSLAGGSSLVVFKNSKNKNAAWKLINYLTEKKQQLKFYNVTGNLPSIRSAWEDSVLSKNIYTKAFKNQLERISSPPKVPEWEQIAMKVQEYGEFFAVNDLTKKTELLMNLDNEVNRILTKRRWLVENEK